MPVIRVTTRDGQSRQIEATNGRSLMENLRAGGIEEILALCGGSRSCATCHVFVADRWLPQLTIMTEDEDDLLDSSDAREANSRLSCQIVMDDILDGIEVTVAPPD